MTGNSYLRLNISCPTLNISTLASLLHLN